MAGDNVVRNMIAEVFSEMADALETGSYGKKIRVGLTLLGSEHGPWELLKGAENAQLKNPEFEIVVIGSGVDTALELVVAEDEKQCHQIMDQMLADKTLDAAVTMHYSFPIGVSTVGKVITPAKGKEMFLATTTGTSSTERVSGMLMNAIYGIASAKASGLEEPTVGLLNIDGARQVERSLKELQQKGYKINFCESARSDGGVVMRGNDLLLGVPDVMVCDSLTGNVLMKMFAAYSSGGSYEALGYGYGPGVGERFDKLICILSRASGAPVVEGALQYAGTMAKGKLLEKTKLEFQQAKKAGFDAIIEEIQAASDAKGAKTEDVKPPPAKPVTVEIPGIEILDLDSAAQTLWKNDIYATTGMGCTGPIVQVAEEDKEAALKILKEHKFI